MEVLVFSISSFALVLIGLYGVLTRDNLVKIFLCMNILETGINLFLVSIGYRGDSEAPIFTGEGSLSQFVDPLPQALVLTSIVIGLGTTAVALVLILNHYRKTGSLSLEDLKYSEEVNH